MVYFDNAATSFPKPPMVAKAMAGTLTKIGGNPGRSGHRFAMCAGRVVEACRQTLCDFFQAPSPERVIFTSGCTEALNLALRGSLHAGDEVLCSHAEHNAVMRVLKTLETEGQICVRVLPPDEEGVLRPQTVREHVHLQRHLPGPRGQPVAQLPFPQRGPHAHHARRSL